jgi:hypothetical protein
MSHNPRPPDVDCCLGNMSMASTQRENVSMSLCYLDMFRGAPTGLQVPALDQGSWDMVSELKTSWQKANRAQGQLVRNTYRFAWKVVARCGGH